MRVLSKIIFFIKILFALLLFSNFNANAQDGCHILASTQHRLYTTPYTAGAGSPTAWIATSENGAGYRLVTLKVCFDDLGPSCVVYRYGTTGSSPSASQILYAGTYGEIVECPIDDFIIALLIFIAGLAYLMLTKENRLNEGQYHYRSL